MPLPHAIIFDLDGTLLDTEAVWTVALTRWLAKYGKTYDVSIQKQMMGRPAKENITLLVERYGLKEDPDKMLEERERYFRDTLKEVSFIEKTGACALIRLIADAGITIGLATSADRDYAEQALASLACRQYFSGITCGQDIVHGKPNPEIYLAAAAQLRVRPEQALAIEDAPAGVASAKAAGMKVVGLFDPRYNESLPQADLEVASFSQLTVAKLQALFT